MARNESVDASGAEVERFVRPAAAAILESQLVPAFFIGSGGKVIIPNTAARRFVSKTATGRGVLAQDGTDLWTVLAARADEADPFYDVRIRLRESSGEVAEVSMFVVPVRVRDGEFGGAMVFVLSVPGERIHLVEQPTDGQRIQGVVERLARFTGADRTYLVEFDLDVAPEARLRAFWSRDGAPSATGEFSLRGAPSAAYAGKRVLSIPRGASASYPDAPLLEGCEAYVGVSLLGDAGEQIGCIAALWHRPVEDVAGMTAVVSIMAVEASRALRDDMARRDLLESEQRYGAVFEGSSVPMVLVEPGTTQIVDANPAACNFYGYPYEELLLMSILQLDALSADALQAELARAAEGARGRFAAQHILSGGRIRDVEVTVGPITVTGRRLLYFMVNDITERKSIEAELDRNRRSLERMVGQRTQDLLRANAELQQASMSRDLVIGSMAQEVRRSIQAIADLSRQLLAHDAGLEAGQREQIERVAHESERLEAFIGTVAEHRRQDAAMDRSEEEFDLVSLVESVSFGLASFAEDKGLRLDFAAEERPTMVLADRYKVQQILLNLLSNAIRYTEEGGVTVTVRPEDDGHVAVAVADTGVGIPEEALAQLFHEPEIDEAKVGIGLPASQRIASAIGGTIRVETEPGTGSAFTLRLPAGERR